MKNILIILIIFTVIANSKTIYIELETEIENLEQATNIAEAGDEITFKNGVYPGGMSIYNLNGEEENPIIIKAENPGRVSIEGGSNAVHFIDCNYVAVADLIFREQTANGLNIDDGGTFDTPSRGITISSCTFDGINASGNDDLLKMSGVDNFQISDCLFQDGAQGGSGIDFVGCHNGNILNNKFVNMGSNAVQNKGGTYNISIQRNLFINAGARSVNLGGSTGMQFFRPIDAPYEARNLKVQANIFVGSQSPIAFVGSDSVLVSNNHIIVPDKWVMRILQENNHERLVQCGDNVFANNIVYVNSNVNVTANIGPNTRAETFLFINNNWFNEDDSGWQPNLPSDDINAKYINPDFLGNENDEKPYYTASLEMRRNGDQEFTPLLDYSGKEFWKYPSIGAYEINSTGSGIKNNENSKRFIITDDFLQINNKHMFNTEFEIYNSNGKIVNSGLCKSKIDISDLAKGVHVFTLAEGTSNSFVFIKK